VVEARALEYERFAAEESLPMFRQQDGFRGVFFGRQGPDCAVITLWRDLASADALEESTTYRDIVGRIGAAGFLVGRSKVERFEIHGSDLADETTPRRM
jgi:heme-degrading monooxygenase HmoA